MTWDEQVAAIIAWMQKQKPPAPGYKLTLVVPIKGEIRFEWRKVCPET